MNDLIYRQEAINITKSTDYRGLTVEDVKKVTDEVVKRLEKLPSAQKTGRWITVNDAYNRISGKCSACGWESHLYEDDVVGMNYCPNCGADMREVSVMNNKEAITLLRNLEDSLDSYCGLNEEGKTAFRMAIEALICSEIPNNSDTISRQAALDAIAAIDMEIEDGEGFDYPRWCGYFSDLPSAEPKTFHVIDLKTGEEANTYEIALKEDWAKSLMYCDMEGFAIEEDGTLILADECGRVAYAPIGRFKVVWDE